MFGFAVLVVGTLVYNEIVIIPYFGLDKNTKIARRARESKDKEALIAGKPVSDNDYMALSPNAAYDANRNARIIERKKKGSFRTDDNDEMEADY